MTIHRLAKPASLNGDQLAAELGVSRFAVSVEGSVLVIDTSLDRPLVEQKVQAHVPAPAPADPVKELLDAVDAASTVSALKSALKAHLPSALGRA